MNKKIEQYLWLFARQRQDDWATLLLVEEFTINSRIQLALQHFPFEVMYSYQPNFIIPASSCSNIPAVDKRLGQLKKAWTNAKAALRQSKKEIMGDGKLPQEFKIGDKV